MGYTDIIKKFEDLARPEAIEGMAKFGITPDRTYGVAIPDLRKIAKEIGKDHDLALKLWKSNIRETRILASMIANPEMADEEQIEQWVEDLDYWEICDQCCMNLIEKTKFAYEKAHEWSLREEEFVKRAGFVMMARLAVSDKKAPDNKFEDFFLAIKREAHDNRNMVKKAVNWAIRQIGKRNVELNKKAITLATQIKEMDSKSTKWIASDAIRELTDDKIQKRLKK